MIKIIIILILIAGITVFGYITLFYNDQNVEFNSSAPTLSQNSKLTDIPLISLSPTVVQFSPTTTIAPTKTIAVPKEITIGNALKRQVILTFDAGSGSDSLDIILNSLAKYNLSASFFLTGKWVEQNGDAVERIAENGHEIFNHTYSHPDLTKINDDQIREELQKTDNLIVRFSNKTSKPYFRPPYGARNSNVLKVAAQEGYTSVYWTTDAWDWRENEGITPEHVKTRVYDNLKPGAIFLFHVGSKTTGIVLDEVILHIRSLGYSIVPLSEGLQ